MRNIRINSVAAFIALGLSAWGSAAVMAQTTVAGLVSGQFAVSESGAATYRVPIQVPPGIAGMEPKIELMYNSQAGNGWVGLGWSLDGFSSITRCPMTWAQDGVRGAVSFNTDDRFCMDGQRLMLATGAYGAAGSTYRTERDSFSHIVANGAARGNAANGPQSFTVQTKAGLKIEFGATSDSQIEAQGKAVIQTWAVNRIQDAKGNYMVFSYGKDASSGTYYPGRIDYAANGAGTPLAAVVFGFETRTDNIRMYHAGSFSQQFWRLNSVKTYSGATMVREYRLAYAPVANRVESILSSIKECNASNQCLPPLQITMPAPRADGFWTQRWETRAGGFWSTQRWFAADADGDGKVDMVNLFGEHGSTSIDVHRNTGNSFQIQRWQMQAGGYADSQKWFALDADGDGKADMVNVFNDNGLISIDVHRSTGHSFQLQRWETQAGGFSNEQKWFAVDVDGDGRVDLVNVFGDNGLISIDVHKNTGTSFQLQRWQTRAGGFSTSQRWFAADADGDGKADLINVFNDGGRISMDVHRSTGTAFQHQRWQTQAGGFAAEQQWLAADMNGDGKVDMINVHKESTNISIDVHISTGATFQIQRWITQPEPYVSDQRWFAVDADGDGRPDLANVHAGYFAVNGPYFNADVTVYRNTGTAFKQNQGSVQGGFLAHQKWLSADVTGDGIDDLISIFDEGGLASINVHKTLASRAVVSRFSVTGSQSTSVSYKHLGDDSVYTKGAGAMWPQVDLRVPLLVVSGVQISGPSGTVTSEYTYGELRAEAGTGRGLLGFGWTKSKNLFTGIEEYSEFRQDWPYTGLVAKSETRVANQGRLLKKTLNTLACKTPHTGTTCAAGPGNRYFVHLAESVEESWDLGGTAFPRITSTYTYGMDPGGQMFGDPSRVVVTNSDGSSKTTQSEYFPANTTGGNWILGRLKRASVTSVKP